MLLMLGQKGVYFSRMFENIVKEENEDMFIVVVGGTGTALLILLLIEMGKNLIHSQPPL